MMLYVSDPRIWEQAFKDLSSGKINPYVYNRQPQTGRGLGGRYSSTFHVPVKAPEKIVVPVKQITPTAAVAERAKSDLKKEKKENVPHVDPKSINTSSKKPKRSTPPSTTKRIRAKDVFDDEPVKKKNRKWHI